MNSYIGNSLQLSGVEEVVLAKGRGKGMTLLEIRNGNGMHITLSADRCMDIPRLTIDGVNMGYFSPCGYVSPQYYDDKDSGFLKSFTAGFLTTCGFANVGSPCIDKGETLQLHGTIGNTPCENYLYKENDECIIVEATVRDAAVFGNKYLLNRTYKISKKDNSFTIEDNVLNIDSKELPCLLLYHFNMGYPLLSENAIVAIPAISSVARDEHANEDFENRMIMEKPQAGYQERCYFYDVKENNGVAKVGIFNTDINKGLVMEFDKNTLDCFTEWKMMGEYEYVLGLEPANCTPDGRKVQREKGLLKSIKPGESYKTTVTIKFTNHKEDITNL